MLARLPHGPHIAGAAAGPPGRAQPTHQAPGPQPQVGGQQEDVALVALAEQLAALAEDAHDDGGVRRRRRARAADEDQVGHRAADLVHAGTRRGLAALRHGLCGPTGGSVRCVQAVPWGWRWRWRWPGAGIHITPIKQRSADRRTCQPGVASSTGASADRASSSTSATLTRRRRPRLAGLQAAGGAELRSHPRAAGGGRWAAAAAAARLVREAGIAVHALPDMCRVCRTVTRVQSRPAPRASLHFGGASPRQSSAEPGMRVSRLKPRQRKGCSAGTLDRSGPTSKSRCPLATQEHSRQSPCTRPDRSSSQEAGKGLWDAGLKRRQQQLAASDRERCGAACWASCWPWRRWGPPAPMSTITG